MCGICGSFADRAGVDVDPDRVRVMARALLHRGPDDEGFHDAPRASFGFRRLSILDLSAEGNQPHRVGDGDDEVVTVVNGELYNFRDLRDEVTSAGVTLRSSGDMEVVAHLYRMLGDAFVERLHGMFALALYDRRRHRLLLARDRLGKKPLYYRQRDERLDFASEPKALLAGESAVAPDRAGLAAFLEHGVVPGSASAFAGLRRVAPGHLLVVDERGARSEPYWRPPIDVTTADHSVDEWKDAIFARLTEAVHKRLVADVPVGIFLSGGIDSGLILAAAADGRELQTFTIGFDDPRYDERALAAATAARFGVDPEVLVANPSPTEALGQITEAFDEPFGDPSAYPTLMVSRLARTRVKVALSGDGGDELFAGYRRHRALVVSQRIARFAPRALRRLGASLLGEAANGAAGRSAFGQLRRFAAALGLDAEERNRYWSTFFRGPARRRFLHPELLEETRIDEAAPSATSLRGALARDLTGYLVDDLLVKTDTASMAHSLEVRSPFLDHELVELAARVPESLLLRGGETKHLLREIARDRLPPEVAAASKRGFGVPLAEWLRGPLRPVAEEHLLGERFASRRLLRSGGADELLRRHRSGREDWSSYLWLLMIAEAWFRRHVDR